MIRTQKRSTVLLNIFNPILLFKQLLFSLLVEFELDFLGFFINR